MAAVPAPTRPLATEVFTTCTNFVEEHPRLSTALDIGLKALALLGHAFFGIVFTSALLFTSVILDLSIFMKKDVVAADLSAFLTPHIDVAG